MKKIIIVALMALVAAGAQAKGVVKPKGYIFGLSASFSDSTVYFTDIQALDSVWVEQKKETLLSRENYSAQLKNYFTSRGESHRTCLVVFSTKRKQVEKKFVKLKKLYTSGKKSYDVRFLGPDDFHFVTIDLKEIYSETVKKK